jgi:hypothetical protein
MTNLPLPQDIKPSWFKVIRRLQSIASRDNQGYAVVTISILVDVNGDPIAWAEPKMCKIEPKRSDEIINLLANSSQLL